MRKNVRKKRNRVESFSGKNSRRRLMPEDLGLVLVDGCEGFTCGSGADASEIGGPPVHAANQCTKPQGFS